MGRGQGMVGRRGRLRLGYEFVGFGKLRMSVEGKVGKVEVWVRICGVW